MKKIELSEALSISSKNQNSYKEENHLKLVTYARSLLKSGAPIIISEHKGIGKTKLAREIASYEFDEIVYINPLSSSQTEVISKFTTSIIIIGPTNLDIRYYNSRELIKSTFPYVISNKKGCHRKYLK